MRSVISAILIVLFFNFLACKDPFRTRRPQGSGVQEGHWEFPATPEITIKNLYWAYNEKIISNYITCFADNFRFSPSSADSALYPDRFANWDLEIEIEVTRAIFARDTLILMLTYDQAHHDIISDTLAALYRHYTVVAVPSASAPSESPATGVAVFYLVRAQTGRWLIYLWKDEPERGSWGLLKQEFR